MAGTVPGFLPKTALVASKVVYYPFTIPQQLNDSATNTGKALTGAFAGIVGSVGQAYASLEPRGPAKWLMPLFTNGLEAAKKSDDMAMRNKAVFWDPFSEGSESIGRAIAGPGAAYYLHKAGVENPTAELIKGVLNTKLFEFPPGEALQAANEQILAQKAAAAGQQQGGAPAGGAAPEGGAPSPASTQGPANDAAAGAGAAQPEGQPQAA